MAEPNALLYLRITRGEPTSVFDHIQYLLIAMGPCLSTSFCFRSTERTGRDTISTNGQFHSTEGIGQDETGGESQQLKYALFSYYDYLLVNERGT